MAGRRRKHTDEFKARVALDAIRGVKTLAELSSLHGIHPTVIAQWKRQLLTGASGVFASGSGNGKSQEDLTGPLYQEIGRLKMEVDWLKKKL
jgi:transposase-like protein